MNIEIFKIGKKEWSFHLLFWVLFFSSLLYAWSDNQITTTVTLSRLVSWIVVVILPIYLNALILIPNYFNRANWPKYLIFLLAMLAVAQIFHTLFLLLPWLLQGTNFDFVSEFKKWLFRDFSRLDKFIFGSTTMIVGLSFAYRLGKDWIANEQVKAKLISEKMSMELALLKSQINPHFLFNTLNNIYAIALEEKALGTADNISKLGTLMRYSLHDVQADFILVSKEMDYIERYIEMQRLRITDDDKINISVDLSDLGISNEKIAPMILMPFIENAFKYGVSTTKESMINIAMNFSNGTLFMEVKNTVHAKRSPTRSGLGLANVKDRLRLIYFDKHKLTYGQKDDVYYVNLEIKLKQ